MTLLPMPLVICEYCISFTTLKPSNYYKHIERVHNIFDYEKINVHEKAIADKILIEQHYKKLEEQKQQSNYLNSLLQRLSFSSDDIFGTRETQEEREKKEKERQQKEEDKKKRILQKKQEQLQLQQKLIEDNTHEYQIIWDDIIFEKDYIRFNTNRIKSILKPIYQKGIFESLNVVKQEYLVRLHSHKIFKLCFYKGEIQKDKSPGLNKLLEAIQLAKEIYDFKYSPLTSGVKTKRFDGLSNGDIIKLFETFFNKSNYLKFLAKKQSSQYKLILVKEFISNHVEESFLFQFKAKSGQTLIFWENANEARATHVFLNSENINNTTNLIEEFICRSDLNYKRSLLYDVNQTAQRIKNDLKYVGNIRHKTLHEYEQKFDQLLQQS